MKKLTQPYLINDTKIRLGDKGDGGYITNKQSLTKCDEMYSYGINNCISFDCDWEKLTDKPSYLYDMTCGVPDAIMPKMKFFKEGLSGTKQHDTDNFLQHYKNNNSTSTNVLLKLDIEGAEYEWILNTDMQELNKLVYGMIIEFHWIAANQEVFTKCMNKIKEYYDIYHIHANNYGGVVNGMGDVPEISFIRKSEGLTTTLSNEVFPTKDLDYPNNCNMPDITLDYSAI